MIWTRSNILHFWYALIYLNEQVVDMTKNLFVKTKSETLGSLRKELYVKYLEKLRELNWSCIPNEIRKTRSWLFLI